jgi:hypothetical protein
VAAMRQGLLEQAGVAETVAEPLLEGCVPGQGERYLERPTKSMYRPTLPASGISLR